LYSGRLFGSYQFWTVFILATLQISFFSQLDEFWHYSKPYSKKVRLFKQQFQKGMVLPLFALERDYDYKTALDEISTLDANSVSFFITNYQENIRSNDLYLNQRASEVLQLVEIIEYAHKRGLSVFLFPTLHIQHLGYKEWRGILQPQDPELWWKQYFRIVRFYLSIARDHQVEMFSIGSELCSLEQDEEHWSQIIRYCRNNYSGMLIYSANWDHYLNIPFVRDLDFFGMNAYFELTKKDDPTLPELLEGWEPAKQRIQDAYNEYGIPIIFTEIGYPSVDGTNRYPWDYFKTSRVDLEEQALCYQAFVETWDPVPSYLHGVYFYNWWGPGGIGDRDYTPRDKPAERVIRTWFTSFR